MVGVFFNGYLGSRVQNVNISADLGQDEARELTNSQVVEFSATNPQVSITAETNEYGSVRNLRAIAMITGGSAADNVTVNSFDGTTCDIGIMVSEDGTLKRTSISNEATVTAISWNYDQGGVATENFTFETDNQIWYANTWKQAYSVIGSNAIQHATLGTGSVMIQVSGFGGAGGQGALYQPIKVYIDGVSVTGAVSATGLAFDAARVTWTDSNFTDTGRNYKVVIARTGGTLPTSIPQGTSTSSLGSITRGKIDIVLVSGTNDTFSAGTNFLRLQSVSIDADMSREVLNELGHYRAFDRSLTLPVPVNMTFSSIANDLQDWAKFSVQDGSVTGLYYSITDFNSAKQAKLQIRIYDKNDIDSTRVLKKSITVTGIQVTNQSFGVDVGGNATQDYTGQSNNFLVSGLGTPGFYPLIAAPTD